jgi:two-component system sensor histidine kinase KdpD
MRDRSQQVAIQVGEERVGALIVVRKPGAQPFRREDDRLLSHVAAQLGITLERIRLREEATQAEILRRTDELKTALLNAVSHDLRTPLASILASAGSLLQQDVQWTEQEKRDFARAIEEEAQRLNRLVGNLLDLSRIEAGTMRPDKGWYDIGALVDGVAGRLKSVLADHQFVIDIPDDIPPVFLDYVEIDQVLSNLVENAAKYTPASTEIRISARRLNDDVEIEVADRGPGIREQDLPHLFDAFFRAARPDQPRGTGLGLAVARGLVEAHGGTIRAENRPDGGSRFVVTLPVSPVGAPPEPAGSTPA